MKLFVSLILLYFANLFSQTTSLDTNMDTRAVALGESFVANTTGVIYADNNPATLIGANNPSLFFTKRNINWISGLDDFHFYSVGTAFKTKIGFIGLTYKRFNMGEIIISTPESPEGIGTAKPYDHTITLSYANQLSNKFSFGISIKSFSQVSDATQNVGYKSNTPILLDLGLLYNVKELILKGNGNDNLNFAFAFFNYGTDYKVKGGVNNSERIQKLPRFAKLGFCYSLEIPGENKFNLFGFNLTGEFRTQLNQIYNNEDRNYWGVGLETIFYDFIFLRLGGISNPATGVYGEEGTLTARYGAGLNFPFHLLNIDFPLSISFDYAIIPLNNIGYFSEEKKNLDGFSFQISYNKISF